MTLLEYVESIANSPSANLHRFHGTLTRTARELVKEHGGTLKKIGKLYREGAIEPTPHTVYNSNTQTWEQLYEYNEETGTWTRKSSGTPHFEKR